MSDYLVVTNDGNQVSSSGLKIKKSNGMFLETATINGTTYKFRDIKAYQDKSGYWEKMTTPNHTIFVRRLRKGAINLYHFDSYVISNRREDRGYTDHFAFQKGDSPIAEISKEDIAQLLQDRPKALELFRSYYKVNRQPISGNYNLKKITAVIDAYNEGS